MLSPYIDGELKDDEKERVESHLEGCTFCLAALEEMREASRSFRMFIPVIPPAAMAQAFTGRLAELAGQGTAGRDEATRQQSQAGGGSKFSRLLHGKAVWIGIAAVVLLVPAVTLLADVTGGGDAEAPAMTADSTRATTATAPMQARTQTQARTPNEDIATTQSPDTTSSTDTATVPAGADGSSNSSDAGQTQSPGGGAAPMSVRSGQASPNPVYEKNPAAYTAVISGAASTVTVDLSPRSGGADITVPLTRQSAGSGTETWAATGTAPGYGTYYIYIYATNTEGQTDSLYVGILTVNAMIY